MDKVTKLTGAYLESLARKGAALGEDCGKMCKSCAFKTNQEDLRGYPEAVEGAVQVLSMGGVFNCHTPEFKDAGKPCAGFLYAEKALNENK